MLLGGTQVGWFGVGVAMFAIPVSKATGIDVNILIAVSGLLMTLTIFGISALTILSIIAVPAIVILVATPSGWRWTAWEDWTTSNPLCRRRRSTFPARWRWS